MRRPCPGSWIALGLALALLASSNAPGQDPSDPTSLARYVPAEDLLFLVEFDGVDAHAEAWRKTTAYKILNDTPAGAMIEDVLGQLLDKTKIAEGRRTIGLAKHLLRSGFVLAAGRKEGVAQDSFVVMVARGAFSNKEIRPLAAQFLASLNAPNAKAQAVVRAGHKVYSGKTKQGATYSWWVEDSKKEDVILVFPTPEAADLVLETLDGKRENAVNHPLRADIAKPSGGFEPVGLALVDPKAAGLAANQQFGLTEATRIDLRWGFQDDALQMIGRIATPSPRKGFLAALEGPTFDKGSLPPLPSSVTGFTVASFDTKAAFDQVVALANSASPDAAARFNEALDAIQGKGKLRLREDFLGHLGPKMAFYTLPQRSPESATAAPPAIGALMMAMGVAQLPRGVAVIEVDDPIGFGKALDELMIVVNRELKVLLAPPRNPAAEKETSSRGRAPTPEFRLTSGTPKTYNFYVPPELSKVYPPSFRPSIRLGEKHLCLAVSPDAAREAMEARENWSPPAELAAAFQSLPTKLKFLQVGDNRAAIASTLASFPAKVQILANSPIFHPETAASHSTNAAQSPAPGAEGATERPAPGNESSEGSATGSEPGKPGSGPQPVVIQVAPGNLPSADALREILFPSILALEVAPDEIRLISRVAFPDVSGLAVAPSAAILSRLPGARRPAPATTQPAAGTPR